MADVDNSPWDGGAAMSGCAKADSPAAAYGAICAGKKAGDPALQSSWALPHHMHPGSPPNAAGVRNALSRLPQTQGLTNKQAAQAHLEAHMKVISPPAAKGATPAQQRATAYADRAALGEFTARLEPFTARWQHRATEINGKQFAQLDGYASVTGIEYEMWDIFGPYGETIHPDAFTQTLAASPDVAFLVNHKGLVMARTKNPSGDPTLILDADPRGLHSRAYVNPERTDVRDLIHAVDDGMVTEMSFAFQLLEGEWDDGFEHFTITQVSLDRGDVSAVNYGANPYTSIAARARSIIAELDYLPAGAQRAAYDRLATSIYPAPAPLPEWEDEFLQAQAEALAAHADAQIPVDTTPRGKSVQFYETMLRLG
jgi:HK97 family phage prohead protease